MDAMTILDELAQDNPGIPRVQLQVFGNALRVYCEAADNVRRNGAVVAHPRTGAPIENPYLKVQQAQGKILTEMRRIHGDRVMALLQAPREAPPHA